jgi:hypothetical protein
VLISVTKNRDFRELVKRDTLSRDRFHKDILEMNPFYPKVAHDIQQSTIFGVCDSFAKRFTNTRTLYSLSRRAEKDLASLSLHFDLSFMKSVFENVALVYKIPPGRNNWGRPLSIYQVATTCRNRWGLGALEGVTTVHPLDLGYILVAPRDNRVISQSIHDKIPIVTAMSLTDNSIDCETKRGRVRPYLGSATSDKSVAKWIQPVDSTPPQRDAIKLLQIRHMITKGTGLMADFLLDCAQSRCSYDAGALKPFVREKIGGVIAHRYKMTDADNGSYLNSTITWPSHITLSSNLSGKLGELDQPVSFQEINHTLITLSKWVFQHSMTNAPFGVCLIVPDISLVPVVADHIVSKTTRYLPLIPQSPKLFYALSDVIKVSPRASASARLSELSFPVHPTDPSILDAVTTTFLSALTGRKKLLRRGNSIRCAVVRSRLIDLPECKLLSFSDYLQGAARSCILYSAIRSILAVHRETSIGVVLAQQVLATANLLIPQLVGTVCMCQDIPDNWGFQQFNSQSLETTTRWWISQTMVQAGKELERFHPSIIFEAGGSSVSSSAIHFIAGCLLTPCLRDPRQIPAAKLLCKVLLRVASLPGEPEKMARLWDIMRVTDLVSSLRITPTAPEQVFRSLRGGQSPEMVTRPGISTATPYWVPRKCCTGTDKFITYLSERVSMTPLEKINSYRLRPVISVSDAHYRWGPLGGSIGEGESVLVIGIGAGGILRSIPLTCKVIGVDLASQLESLGQNSIDYQPPVSHPGFSLHPVSWTLGGNVLNPWVSDVLEREVRDGRYSTVIIDCEGVNTGDRLRLRYRFAQAGAKSWVRVPLDTEEKQELIASFCAFSCNGDAIWEPEIDLGHEMVLGCGPTPLGIKMALQGPDLHGITTCHARDLHLPSKLSREQKILGYLTLYDSLPDLSQLHSLDFDNLPCPRMISPVVWEELYRAWEYGLDPSHGFFLPNRYLKALVTLLL